MAAVLPTAPFPRGMISHPIATSYSKDVSNEVICRGRMRRKRRVFMAVLAVAAIAALISYRHAVGVVALHGEPGMIGRLYPVVIDGLIIAASMLCSVGRRAPSRTGPALGVVMLAAGIVATLAVNVVTGAPSGSLGAIVAAWSAGRWSAAMNSSWHLFVPRRVADCSIRQQSRTSLTRMRRRCRIAPKTRQ